MVWRRTPVNVDLRSITSETALSALAPATDSSWRRSPHSRIFEERSCCSPSTAEVARTVQALKIAAMSRVETMPASSMMTSVLESGACRLPATSSCRKRAIAIASTPVERDNSTAAIQDGERPSIRRPACCTIEVTSEMESTGTIGNGGPNISNARIRPRHLQCVGCDRKILWPSVGLQLDLSGASWSSLGLSAFWKCNPKKTASRLRRCVAKRASSGLGLQNRRFGGSGAS
jgi:hypothetical protein